MSYGLFVHFLFSKHKRVKHHRVEEYYPNISKTKIRKGFKDVTRKNFAAFPSC